MRSCARFSRTRFNQESVTAFLLESWPEFLPEKERRNGSCMRRPPFPPRDSARQHSEAGTSRLVRSLEAKFGCLLNENLERAQKKWRRELRHRIEKLGLVQAERNFDGHNHRQSCRRVRQPA